MIPRLVLTPASDGTHMACVTAFAAIKAAVEGVQHGTNDLEEKGDIAPAGTTQNVWLPMSPPPKGACECARRKALILQHKVGVRLPTEYGNHTICSCLCRFYHHQAV